MQIDVLAGLVNSAVNNSPPECISRACGPGEGYASYYHLAYLLAHHMAPCVVVELGVAYGRFLHCAALATPVNTIIGVDIVRYPALDAILSAHGNVAFVNKPSVPVPDEISSVITAIDILHIDTTIHTRDQVKSEFEAYEGMLSDGAVVMFDDLRAAEDLIKYYDSLPYPKIREDRLHSALGYGVMVYTK